MKLAHKRGHEFYLSPAGSIFPASAGKIEGREQSVKGREDKGSVRHRTGLQAEQPLSPVYFLLSTFF
jgi:hypothetical protein